MKKIIDSKVYDTSTATKIADNWNGVGSNDFNYQCETIYRTKKGTFFLHGDGGANTKYATHNGNWRNAGETIIPLTKGEVYQYLEDWNETELIDKLFPYKIEEA
jgi:hypothetical protein